MKFRRILSSVLACSMAMNMLAGTTFANAANNGVKSNAKTNNSFTTSSPKASVPTLDTINCEYCQSILQYREDFYELSLNVVKDPANEKLLQKRSDCNVELGLLQNHECEEKTIYVKNYPYVQGDFYGTYTGYWKGASPDSYGKFVGNSIKETSSFNNSTQITTNDYCKLTYDGIWANGYRNSYGLFLIENYTTETSKYTGKEQVKKYTAESYKGQFEFNFKNGYGSEKTVFENGDYIKYEEGTYKNDVLQGTVSFERYNSSDKLLSTGTAKEENGKKIILTEEKEEEKKKNNILLKGALIAGAALVGAALLSGDSDTYYYDDDYSTEYDSNQYWADYHAEQEAKRKKAEEEEAERIKQQQQWDDDNYYYYKNTYGDDYSETQKWKKWSGN